METSRKLSAIKSEVAAAKEAEVLRSDEALKRNIEENEKFELTPEQQEALKQIGEENHVEIGNVKISDIISDLSVKFDLKEMAEPALQYFENAEKEAVFQLQMSFDLDESDFSNEELEKGILETWELMKNRLNINPEIAQEEYIVKKIAQANLYSELPEVIKKAIFPKYHANGVGLIPLNKYTEIMYQFIPCVLLIAAKESMNVFIEKELASIELITLQQKTIEDIMTNTDKTEITKKTMSEFIAAMKQWQPDIELIDDHSNIRFELMRRYSVLNSLAAVYEVFTDENQMLQDSIREEAINTRAKAEVFKRLSDLNFLNPIKTYYETIKDSPKASAKINEQIITFIEHLTKSSLRVSFPGYKPTSTTFAMLVKDMNEYFKLALRHYHLKREELLAVNPKLDLPIFTMSLDDTGAFKEDFGSESFTTFVLLLLSRFDKKHLKGVDTKTDKIAMLEYFLVFDTMSKVADDVYMMAEIVRFGNAL